MIMFAAVEQYVVQYARDHTETLEFLKESPNIEKDSIEKRKQESVILPSIACMR